MGLHVRDAEQSERGRRGLGLPHRLHGGEFHFLVVGDGVTALVAEHDDRQSCRNAEGRRDHERPLCEFEVTAAQDVEGRNAEHEGGAANVTGGYRVDELRLRGRIEQHGHEIGHFHPHRVGIEGGADRVLHPAIGDQDPQRRQIGAEPDQPGDGEMGARGQPVPAKEEQADEGRLQEEGHQPLDRQRRAENVADVMRVEGPVHSELEFHGETGGNAKDEVDAEQQAPEPGHVAPDGSTRHHVDGFHHRHEDRQSERQRHEQKVIHRGQRELEPGKLDEKRIGHVRAPFERSAVT